MKNLIILGIFLISFSGIAQKQSNPERVGKHFKEMTPEQRATLKSKHLALALDLNPSQLGSVKELETKKAIDHQAKWEKRMEQVDDRSEVGPDEKFDWMNNRLDEQLAYKEAMKQILSKEQFEKWERLQMRHGMSRRFHHEGRHSRARRR